MKMRAIPTCPSDRATWPPENGGVVEAVADRKGGWRWSTVITRVHGFTCIGTPE